MPDSGRDLERELRDLGSRVEYPRTPDLSGSVRRRIEAEDEARTRPRGPWLPALSPGWAVAAMFVIVLAVPILSPGFRDEFSNLLVIGKGFSTGAGDSAASPAGEAVTGTSKATPEQAGQAGPQAAAAGEAAAVPESEIGGQTGASSSGHSKVTSGCDGEKIPLHQARIRVGARHPVLLPARRGYDQPDEVFDIKTCYGAPALGLVYHVRPGLPAIGVTGIGLVLTETPRALGTADLANVPGHVEHEHATVGGKRAYWLPNARLDPFAPGRATTGSRGRPRINALLWQRGGLWLRLQSRLTKEEATRLAESVR